MPTGSEQEQIQLTDRSGSEVYQLTEQDYARCRRTTRILLSPIFPSDRVDDIILGLGELFTNILKHSPCQTDEVVVIISWTNRVCTIRIDQGFESESDWLEKARADYKRRARESSEYMVFREEYSLEGGSLGIGIAILDKLFGEANVVADPTSVYFTLAIE